MSRTDGQRRSDAYAKTAGHERRAKGDPNTGRREKQLSEVARVAAILAHPAASQLKLETVERIRGYGEKLVADPLRGLTGDQRATLARTEEALRRLAGEPVEGQPLPRWMTAPASVSAADRGLPTRPPGQGRRP